MILVDSTTPVDVIDPEDGQVKSCMDFDLVVDLATLEADLAAYDPASGTSPSVTVARKYARAILDAYAASKAGEG